MVCTGGEPGSSMGWLMPESSWPAGLHPGAVQALIARWWSSSAFGQEPGCSIRLLSCWHLGEACQQLWVGAGPGSLP